MSEPETKKVVAGLLVVAFIAFGVPAWIAFMIWLYEALA